MAECRRDERVVGITAAMNSGTGLNILQKELPERYYDVGIAEQHAVLFAAGLALAGRQAGGRDLLDLPAARLRPDRPRRLPAEAERGVRDGPRRPGGRRRPHPPRRLRHLLPALPAQHRADGPARRGDAGAHAAHRAALRRRARSRCATRAARPRACRCRADAAARSRSGAASCCARASAWRCSATATACRWRSARPSCWPTSTGWSPPWPTPASPSRSTPSWSSAWRPTTTLLVTVEENVLAGGFGSAVLEELADRDLLGGTRVLRLGLPDRYVTHGKPGAAARGGRPHARGGGRARGPGGARAERRARLAPRYQRVRR